MSQKMGFRKGKEIVLPEKQEEPETIITDTGVALYSNFISTSTGGMPATIGFTAGATASTPFYAEMATQPNRILQLLYIIIGSGVFISLMFSVLIEIRRQQPIQIAYGVGLLSLMFGLFYIHSVLTHGASIM